MPTITELPNDASDSFGTGQADSDHQLQPMGSEDSNLERSQNSSSRDAGREVLEAQIANEREQYQPSASEKVFAIVKSMLMRGMIIYFFMQFFRRPQPNQAGAPGADGTVQLPKGAATNLFENGTLFDLYVFLSETEEFAGFKDPDSLVWKKTGLMYGDWYSGPNEDGTYSFSTQFEASETLQNNGSVYLHSYVVAPGKSPDPSDGKGMYSKKRTIYKRKQLNKFKKKTYGRTANLLTGKTDATQEEQDKANEGIKQEIFSHWHPNITVNLVVDYTNWAPGQVPPPIDEFVEFTPSLQNYKPIFYVNNYWNLNKEYMPINKTVKTLNLTVTYQPISMFKWQMYSAQDMRNRFNIMASLMAEENEHEDDDQDSIKEAFLETNIYLLVLTFVVSIIHSIFEFLAFKNDIQFWNNRKSLEGLSVRSVFFNVFQSVIVLLYVLDNETNTIIKVSCFVGLIIEIWKINKVVDFSINQENPTFLGIFPRLQFKDKGNYEESGTKEYDRMAFKYLGMALFPLALAYCVYSVIYNEHKGWYSFILSSCYGFLLTFGFIMMTPQLFINYKLKSVAHLPWRMMTYKALNTFIDDIFAFVIKMPTMYRIGCFRDDIVFFIFLYQKYAYRVDHSRVNEFGFSGDMLEEAEKKKIQSNTNGNAIQSSAPDQTPLPVENSKKQKSAKAKKSD